MMNEQQLRALFQQPSCSEDNYKTFVQEVLKPAPKNLEWLNMPLSLDLPNEEDKGWYLGSMDTTDNYKIGFFRFCMEDSVTQRRVGLRQLVKKYSSAIDAALAVFDDGTHWRLSFICDLKKEATAPKRFTFVFGDPNGGYRTPVSRFMALQQGAVTFETLRDAFSVEALSDEFFKEYKAFYEDIVQYMCGSRYVKEGNKYVRKEIESKTTIEQRGIFEKFASIIPQEITDEEKRIEEVEKLVRDYVKKLLGRLVFIQFIAKKGWMGLKPTDAWGEGEEHFLRNIYDDYKKHSAKDNFVCDVLNKVLFYSLNNTNEKDGDVAICTNQINTTTYKFPYLNGGLFEETALDKKLSINIPSYFFVADSTDNDPNAHKTSERRFKGKPREGEQYPYDQSEGLFEFFERYNFTIDENDSDEAVVGIDPEMLGKIFENLLEDNKDKGAFYTPKPIVEYMCQQSLIAYLQNGVLKAKSEPSDKATDSSKKVIAALSAISDEEIKAQIEQFVKTKSLQCTISVESRQGLGEVGIESGLEKDSKSEKNTTEKVVMSDALVDILNQLLKNVKICDPAIGSGAFPMGLLNELLACRETLQSCGGAQKTSKQLSRAELKKEIIQNNIYGVDIEEGAIEIARLRFWLSIVIDLDHPEPLPNFDFKFMQGNSLLESFVLPGTKKPFNLNIQEMQKGQLAFPHLKTALTQLHSDLDKFYRESNHNLKATMRGNIKKQVVAVLNAYVDYEPLKMQEIAAIAAKTKEDFTCTDFFLWHTWFADVFDKGGFDIVIGNPPYINIANIKDSEIRKAYKKTYTTIRNKSDLYSIFTEKAVYLLRESGISSYIFSNSWMGTDSFLLFRKFLIGNTKIHKLIDLPDRVFKNASVRTCIILYTKSKVNECDIALENYDGKCFMPIGVLKYSNIKKYANYPFNFEKGTDIDTTEHVLLGDISSITLGIKTSNDNKFISSEPFSEDSYQLIRGRNFQRYGIPISEEWIWYRPDLFMEKVGAGPRKLEYFQTNTKILIQDVAQDICATLDEHQLLCNDTINVIYKLKEGFAFKYVLALLNSHIVRFWHKNMFPEGLHVKKYQLKTIPIPIISSTRQQEIISIVDKILSAKKQNPNANTTNYERQIDALVYELYGITSYEELLEIEGDKDKATEMLVLMHIQQNPTDTEQGIIIAIKPIAPVSNAEIQAAIDALVNDKLIDYVCDKNWKLYTCRQ